MRLSLLVPLLVLLAFCLSAQITDASAGGGGGGGGVVGYKTGKVC